MPTGGPDIEVSVRQTFGIDSDLQVPAFSRGSDYVPQTDETYRFDRDTTLAILAGVLLQLLSAPVDGGVVRAGGSTVAIGKVGLVDGAGLGLSGRAVGVLGAGERHGHGRPERRRHDDARRQPGAAPHRRR